MSAIQANIEGKEVLSTTDLCALLGFNVSVSFLRGIGLKEAFATSTGIFWLKSDRNIILTAIAQHVLGKIE